MESAGRRTKKRTTADDNISSTSTASPTKTPKRQAKEKQTEDKSGSTSKSPRKQLNKKPKADVKASNKTTRKTRGQTNTSMENDRQDMGNKPDISTGSDVMSEETVTSIITKVNEMKEVGNDLFKKGNFSSAVQKYEEALSMLENPETMGGIHEQEKHQVMLKIYLNLSICYLKMKEPEKSLKYGRNALSLDPDNSKALYRCGMACRELDQLDHALEFLQQAQKQCPKDPAIKKELAGIRRRIASANKASRSSGSKSTSLPPVYTFEDLSFHERWQAYYDEILVDCKYCEVETGFEYYLGENVRHENWRAVWCSYDLHCDILIKVKNASKFPDAEVELVEPFCCETNSLGIPEGDGQQLKTKEDVQTFLKANGNKVKLLELYPVCEDDELDAEKNRNKDGDDRDSDEESEFGDMEETAKALEHYRFFYAYIWRVMDEFQQTEGYFACKDLRPRLQMYYDVKEKKVSESICKLYTDTMKEYQEKNRLFQMKRSDSNAREEANKLWKEVGQLYNMLNKLDDPATRNHCKMRAKKAKVTHLVANKFTPELIESASLDKETTTKQHNTLASALKACYNLDTILIFPGRYSGKGFTKFSKDIIVKGTGQNPSEVVIAYQQKSFACVESTAFDIIFSNLTFEGEPPCSKQCCAALLVEHGQVEVNNCVFKSFPGGLQVSEDGHLRVEKCEIYDIDESGIIAEMFCNLYIANTHIHHCGGPTSNADPAANADQAKKKTTAGKMPSSSKAGVFVQAPLYGRSPYQTNVDMRKNKIENTGGPGVWLQLHGQDDMGMCFFDEKPESKAYAKLEDMDMAAVMAGVNWFSMDHEFKNNTGGVAYLEFIE